MQGAVQTAVAKFGKGAVQGNAQDAAQGAAQGAVRTAVAKSGKSAVQGAQRLRWRSLAKVLRKVLSRLQWRRLARVLCRVLSRVLSRVRPTSHQGWEGSGAIGGKEDKTGQRA